MSQPNDQFMQSDDHAPSPQFPSSLNKLPEPSISKGKISSMFAKMVRNPSSSPSLPPVVPPKDSASSSSSSDNDSGQSSLRETASSASSVKDGSVKSILVNVEASRPKRLSKRFKRFSAPAKRVSWADNAEDEQVNKSKDKSKRFSVMAVQTPRSISNPVPRTSFNSSLFVNGPQTSTPDRTPSPQPAVRPPTGVTYRQPSPLGQSTKRSSSSTITPSRPNSYLPSPSPGTSSPPNIPGGEYNPLTHHVPCVHPSCSNHYLTSSLGPTFYSSQAPYNLHRKRGLCPQHAYTDLKVANAECKSEWESMRQNAGRKTLGDVAAEFELFIRIFDSEREKESRLQERRQKLTVLGLSRRKQSENEQWWRYLPRPCTKKGCTHLWYSPFASHLYGFYTQSPKRRLGGLKPLSTLCPACANENLTVAEAGLKMKREELDDEEWILWAGKMRKDRESEILFWETAQERVVREKGVRWMTVEEEEVLAKSKEKEVVVEGKGVDVVRELCVVM